MRISDGSSDVCSSDLGHEGSTLSARLTKEVEDYSGWQDHVVGLPTAEELRAGLPAFKPNCIEPAFSPAFFVRMLFSCLVDADFRSEEHTSELPSLMRISYAVFCLKKKKIK